MAYHRELTGLSVETIALTALVVPFHIEYLMMTLHSKHYLRKEYRAIRHSIPQEEATQASHTIIHTFTKHIPYESHHQISVYYPFPDELDVIPLACHLNELDCKILLPCILEKQKPLAFYPWNLTKNSLEKGPFFNIPQPQFHPSHPPSIPDIMILPILAFDQYGYRLGYGGGYYDRTIDHLYSHGHKPLLVGVGYNCQYVNQLSIEPSDHKLDMVVTEKKLFDFR